MGANENIYRQILGNIYFGYFLGFLLIVGATMAMTWPEKSHGIPVLFAVCLSVQLLIMVYLIWVFIDDDCKGEDNLILRLLTHLILGSVIPYIIVSGINYTYSVIFNTGINSPLYSKYFIGVSMVIVFVFNFCMTAYFYGLANKKEDNEYQEPASTDIYAKYIWAKYGLENFKLKLSEASYFQVIDKITLIYYSDNEVYTVRKSLKYLQSILDPDRFMQINRSCIINRGAFSSYKNREDGGLDVYLNYNKKETQVRVSCEKAGAIINWMNGQSELKQGNSEYKKLLIPCL